jgi:hypothetical protein
LDKKSPFLIFRHYPAEDEPSGLWGIIGKTSKGHRRKTGEKEGGKFGYRRPRAFLPSNAGRGEGDRPLSLNGSSPLEGRRSRSESVRRRGTGRLNPAASSPSCASCQRPRSRPASSGSSGHYRRPGCPPSSRCRKRPPFLWRCPLPRRP